MLIHLTPYLSLGIGFINKPENNYKFNLFLISILAISQSNDFDRIMDCLSFAR